MLESEDSGPKVSPGVRYHRASMLRLVAYAPDGVQRFPLHRDEMVIGSEADCDIRLPYTGVSGRHARLVRRDGELRVEDLGSRKGVQVSGKRVREATLEVLDEIRLGGVTLLVEDVVPETPQAAPEPEVLPEVDITPASMIEHLARISDWVLADAESRTTLESLVSDLLRRFGGGVLFLFQGEAESAGMKFVVTSEAAWLSCAEDLLDQVGENWQSDALGTSGAELEGRLAGNPAWVCCHLYKAMERRYFLVVALPRYRPDLSIAAELRTEGGETGTEGGETGSEEGPPEAWSPRRALRTLGDLLILGLVHHVGWYEPILPGKEGRQNLTLDPGLIVGESKVMQQLVEQLKAAVDPPVQVLLRGEPGVGKELLARSLHLSGSRRHGPFVTAGCGGVEPFQIEADLFGAEIPGKEGPVRRQGKLQLADGGTLYLQDVDQLPLELQARLVRFLRSSEVEPAGSQQAQKVNVRLIASSRGPLEPLVARDRLRVDLAYRLSQFAIDVPRLRERKEDLPLLIQSYINRFCHESSKRVQGITVKAMTALLNYEYPGNLTELENIGRQLVNLCPNGQPIESNLLPERVRGSELRAAARVDSTTELDLERLVAECEGAAIREALRRSNGNKSQAARLLGLSRNGLAMKMQRYGLQG